MAIMDFVIRLAELLNKEPQVARWSEDGKQFEIFNVLEFQTDVLSRYFRHNKLQSFIRQLNMYGFRKISRRKNEVIFHHEHFMRDVDEGYHLIKRKAKPQPTPKVQLETSVQIKEQVESLKESQPNFVELLHKLLKFKDQIKQNHKALKSSLDLLSKDVSNKKSRIIKPMISQIKQCFKDIELAGKKVQECLAKNTLPKEKKKTSDFHNWPTNSKSVKFMSTPNIMTYEDEKKHRRYNEGFSLIEFGSNKSIGSYFS